MKKFKSFSAAMKHEMGEKGYESEREEGHGDMKGHPSVKQIAHKHNITPEEVVAQVKKGYKLEKEHTNNVDMAIDIALQHVNEFPTYYDELVKMETGLKKKHSKFKDNKIEEALGDRKFCSLCGKHEYQQECKHGPDAWKKYSIATVHPGNFLEDVKHGLYYNVNKRKEKGLPPKKPGQEGYPTTKSWKESEKTAKKEEYTFNENLEQARKNVGASKCWTGKVAKGTKMKGGKEVPNCVPKEDTCISFSQFMQLAESSPAWQRKEGKNPKGGLNKKGIASYRKEHPGSKLSLAVTKKPSELKPGSKSANRRKSFCARMSGMKSKLTSTKTANDPNSRINKSLRKWNC